MTIAMITNMESGFPQFFIELKLVCGLNTGHVKYTIQFRERVSTKISEYTKNVI